MTKRQKFSQTRGRDHLEMSKRRMTHTNANGATGDDATAVSVEIECAFLVIRGQGGMDVRV